MLTPFLTVCAKWAVFSEPVTYSLTIFKDFQWFVSYFGHKVPGFAELSEKITTVSRAVDTISLLDECITCVGNPDEKYQCLIEERKGVFMDSSGMWAS